MKRPRITVGGLMVALIVIALDCVAVRSVFARAYDADLRLILFATLPMANLLGVGIARMAGGRVRPRRVLVGFGLGSLCGLIATIVAIKPVLNWLESYLIAAGLAAWFERSPIYSAIGIIVIVVGLPFLGQLLVGLAGGWITWRLGGRPAPPPLVEPSPSRHSIRGVIVLVALVATPAVAVEGILRWKVDSNMPRLLEGSEAVVDVDDPWGIPGRQVARTRLAALAKVKVRIEEDRGANLVELLAKDARTTLIRDGRTVQVKVLGGSRAGESIGLPYYMLRPIR